MKQCKFCNTDFEPRRKNHVYCTTSCKTMASYKRNKYKYVPGHYQKDPNTNRQLAATTQLPQEKISQDQLPDLATKSANNPKTNIAQVAAGNLLADASVYGIKKLLAPNSLPATKGDVQNIQNQLNSLKAELIHFLNKKI